MKNNTYVIGEIGQNHNGSESIAIEMINRFKINPYDETFNKKLKGLDAIKFTKRDLTEELTNSAMNKPYDNPNSFGKTYGEHRAYLEFDDQTHYRLYKYVKEIGLDYVITLTSLKCSSIFKLFKPDKLKVASRDLTNLPLLEMLAETKIPIIISTGMSGKDELDQAISTINKYHNNISILHCVSQYPTEYKNVNLFTIKYLEKHYKEYIIGYSDHTIGISTAVSAVAMGAKIIEKHITLDRTMKGTDQAGSLEPLGMNKMIRDIRNLEASFGEEKIFMCPDVIQSKTKLARSIATIKKLKKGHVITSDDIHMLSPGDGFKWSEKNKIIGKTLLKDINTNEIIYNNYV